MTPVNKAKLAPLWLGWSIWGLAGLLYLLGFYHRISTNVLAEALTLDFQLTAAGLGNLSACYFYSYFAMQLPTGVFVDRWGPRRILTIGAFVSAIGTLIFAMAMTSTVAGLGRLLIGGSVAVAYVCMMRLAADWLPSNLFTIATGFGFIIGVVGGTAAGTPLLQLLSDHGWRPIMFALAIISFLLSGLIWWRIRDKPKDLGYRSHFERSSADRPLLSLSQSVRTVFSYRNSLLLMAVPGALSGSVNTFCGLWGNPFLTSQYGMSPVTATTLCTAVLICWALGGPIWGVLSERIAKRKPPFLVSSLMVAVCWALIITTPKLPVALLVILLLIAGFAAGSLTIGYAFAKESVPHYLAGTAGGLNNGSAIFGTVLMQPLIGVILDHFSTRTDDGHILYEFIGFQFGFGLFVVWSLVGAYFIWRLQETHCHQQS